MKGCDNFMITLNLNSFVVGFIVCLLVEFIALVIYGFYQYDKKDGK